MECEYFELDIEFIPADLEAELAACIPDANLAIACCVSEERTNGDVAEDESLSFSPLFAKVELSAEAVVKLEPVGASPLTEARNGKAVAALNAPALPGS